MTGRDINNVLVAFRCAMQVQHNLFSIIDANAPGRMPISGPNLGTTADQLLRDAQTIMLFATVLKVQAQDKQ